MNFRNILVFAVLSAAATACFAQPNRILSRIDSSKTFLLPGRVHPLATAANDAGEVESGFPLPGMSILLKSTPAQQAKLEQLLASQQNPASPQYRQWLTPEQYADQFGVSASDIAQITQWLEGQGFTVNSAARSRTFVSFSGTAGQVHNAFGTTIHRYKVNGVMHYANSTDLTIPAALSPLVAGVRGLHDFHPKPHLARAKPNWTLGPGDHVMAPDDFATIYDITPMYSAGTNGTGQKIAVVGQSEVYTSDIATFWRTFGLTSVTLTPVLVDRQNPGYLAATGDLDESSLDLEWAGGVARNANIEFVYSYDVWTSAQYAVDNAVAPVISMSYGNCEIYDLADLPSYRQMVQQANSEGITWLAAAGDQGATDCDAGATVAENGLAVDEPGSIPEVTSMGGTALSNSGSYWNVGNSATEESAKGYIPEVAWNEPAQAGMILGTGGGASMYFPQPSWQTNAGVPNDGWRHVPDISFNASVYSVPYNVYCSRCEDSTGWEQVGGTSAATPTMAGVVALLNQYLNTNGLGNINPTIYGLWKTAPSAFHNNITGNNIEACAYGSPGCSNGQEGYTVGTSGYSSVVGFGSVDVTNLIHGWKSAQPSGPIVVASLDQNPVYQGNQESCGSTGTWNFQLTLSEEGGFATSVGDFTIGGVTYSPQTVFGTTSIGARQSITGCMSLSSVNAPANEVFDFSGSGWSTSLNIPFQGPQAQLNVGGVTNGASYAQVYAPGMILAVFGTGMGTLFQAASTLPLPEMMGGVEAAVCEVSCNDANEPAWPAPIYFVSANQINIQIPYEASGAVDLQIGNPYALTDYLFTISPIAPGIFTFLDNSNDVNPNRTATRGQATFLYITGDGQVTPKLPDGTSPAAGTPLQDLPKPREAVTVTVGGVQASTTDANWFIGIPPGLVGVTQINFTVPANAPTGRQPVVVTVGTVSTPVAYITVQ
ncbi:MAG TPA: protease pro-enzyme activation domain-containing protein [Bryobacteraceae bacterium]|nr:protease pro-enzyme activation domain-containing protein [Bryobacteraceae bacterium]